MIRSILALCLILVCHSASATKIADMPLAKLTHSASDIAVARVVNMVGKTADGTLVTKGKFRTGPGMGNTVWTTLRILEVLKGKALEPGMTQNVPLWPMWHMEADLSNAVEPSDVIVFFKRSGSKLAPAYEPQPYLPASLAKNVRALLSRNRSQPAARKRPAEHPGMRAAPLPLQPRVDYLASEHGWQVCRYMADIEMPESTKSRYSLTVELTAQSTAFVSLRENGKPIPNEVPRRVRLTAGNALSLLDVRLEPANSYTAALPIPQAIEVLRTIGERRDVVVPIDSKRFAGPRPAGASQQWHACLDGISRDLADAQVASQMPAR